MTCSICLENMPKLLTNQQKWQRMTTGKPANIHENYKTIILPCGHRFHEKCIEKWFKFKCSPTCPLCRKTDISRLLTHDHILRNNSNQITHYVRITSLQSQGPHIVITLSPSF